MSVGVTVVALRAGVHAHPLPDHFVGATTCYRGRSKVFAVVPGTDSLSPVLVFSGIFSNFYLFLVLWVPWWWVLGWALFQTLNFFQSRNQGLSFLGNISELLLLLFFNYFPSPFPLSSFPLSFSLSPPPPHFCCPFLDHLLFMF